MTLQRHSDQHAYPLRNSGILQETTEVAAEMTI